jgi:hypothetical protein
MRRTQHIDCKDNWRLQSLAYSFVHVGELEILLVLYSPSAFSKTTQLKSICERYKCT